jgi:HSP20 family protein
MAVSKCFPFCLLLLLFLTEVSCQGFVPSILGRVWSPGNDIWQDPFHILEENPLSALGGDIDKVSLTRVDWKETPEAHIIKIDVPGNVMSKFTSKGSEIIWRILKIKM